MKFENYKSGIYINQYQYKSFLPSKVNQEWTWDDARINVLLEKATQSLGELNAFSLIVPNVDLFIHMHILKEANTSSRIEGTNTELEDVIRELDYVEPEKRDIMELLKIDYFTANRLAKKMADFDVIQ